MNDETKKTEYRERFVRWQSRMIDQLSFVNNLFIVLATGVLAFQTNLILQYNQVLKHNELFFVTSILLSLFSLVSGCYVAINRLRDFSTTRNIINSRRKGEDDEHRVEMQNQSKEFGKKTWEFLKYQVISWLLSIFVILIVSIQSLFFS